MHGRAFGAEKIRRIVPWNKTNLINPQRFAGGFGRYLEDHNAEDGRIGGKGIRLDADWILDDSGVSD